MKAVITGGMSGLGAACATRLGRAGVDVIRFDVAKDADGIVDVSVHAAVAAAAVSVGDTDILLNCAGIVGPNAPLWEVDDDTRRRVFAVNVHGTFAVTKAFVPGMRKKGWGRIDNFASIAGKAVNPDLSAYSTSKAAAIAMTKSLGKELATGGVRVNTITPAMNETPMNDDTSPEVLAHITSLIPMKRVGRAEEVAELVARLASDRVSFSTGAVYDISGGRAT